ncbi:MULTISPECIES: spore coat U domain-containing protein [unclassified Acinetobacter]|uniref:Csu type fimbrial protein n=1 Tax=unclassified Acinetobacter TaxID=196816 RepID=UPI00293415FE|nr:MULTISPECIES: spore coat U domain-containing protein [unclassified Acinetobacter]WOE33221.1 spore coat U domain-containing protein [Acinetobacter sp. SAAs470]WOE36998.1 spore coat U domain-containing protein [Acinetobacter sp. SAAs474]
MKKVLTTALFAATGLLAIGQVNAAATSTQFQVKIEVLSTCSVNATDIDFGSVNSGVAATDKNGTLNVTCTNQTPYTVGLSSSGAMKHSTDQTATIAYQLFQSNGTTEWNNESNKYSGVGSGNAQQIPVLAKVSGSTNVRAGNYADTVTATVTY